MVESGIENLNFSILCTFIHECRFFVCSIGLSVSMLAVLFEGQAKVAAGFKSC